MSETSLHMSGTEHENGHLPANESVVSETEHKNGHPLSVLVTCFAFDMQVSFAVFITHKVFIVDVHALSLYVQVLASMSYMVTSHLQKSPCVGAGLFCK